jgi:hypothetical protein
MANPYLPVSIATSQQSLAAFGHPPTLHDMSSTFSSGGIGQRQQQPRQQDQNQSGHRPIDSFHYTAHQDQTTLVLGVMNYLERLEGEIAEMKEFINLGFKRIETIGQEEGGIAASIEEYVPRPPSPHTQKKKGSSDWPYSMRLQNRNWNRAHVTELDENFRLLPRLTGEYPTDIPTTGEVLKEASRTAPPSPPGGSSS